MANSHPAFGASMGNQNVRHFASFDVLSSRIDPSSRRKSGSHSATSPTRQAWVLMALSFFANPLAIAQSVTPQGTVIRNAASVSYVDDDAATVNVQTNEVAVAVVPMPSLSSISILRSAASAGSQVATSPTQCRSTTGFVTLPAPTTTSGAPLDLTQPISLIESNSLHGGEPVFVRLVDADRNRDVAVADVVEVELSSESNDRETLRLAETGIDTGVFVGYVQTRARAATAGNCVLEVERNAELSSSYVDPDNTADASRANALVDPYGLIFDSSSGEPVNGARVRLVDAATNSSATVFGDDGVSAYPPEMVTGETVTDAGGTVYTLPDRSARRR